MRIALLTEQHWPQVRTIYVAGTAIGDATCETEQPQWMGWDAAHLVEHRFVELEVLGWVAASRVSSRAVYAGVVEESVYVHPDARGRGVGRRLLGVRERIGQHRGRWRDVVLLERRSPVVG